jgi:hypothetical protein
MPGMVAAIGSGKPPRHEDAAVWVWLSALEGKKLGERNYECGIKTGVPHGPAGDQPEMISLIRSRLNRGHVLRSVEIEAGRVSIWWTNAWRLCELVRPMP